MSVLCFFLTFYSQNCSLHSELEEGVVFIYGFRSPEAMRAQTLINTRIGKPQGFQKALAGMSQNS